MKNNKMAWLFLAGGVGCLILYLILVFNVDSPLFITILLVVSVSLNVTALNLFILKGGKNRREEDEE